MCLAAPSRVLEVRNGMAVTECFGQVREVSLLLMDEDICVGGFAFERVESERAEQALALMREFMEQDDAAREWGAAAA
jgi:hydrogenase expression/formation protein HypC